MTITKVLTGVVVTAAAAAGLTAIGVNGEEQMTALRTDPMTAVLITETDLPAGYQLTVDQRARPQPWQIGCGNTLEPAVRTARRAFERGTVTTTRLNVHLLEYTDTGQTGRQMSQLAAVLPICKYEKRIGHHEQITAPDAPPGAVTSRTGQGADASLIMYAPTGRHLVIVTTSSNDLETLTRTARSQVDALPATTAPPSSPTASPAPPASPTPPATS
jgi:hypothetical protein